jgi:CheY-like chemotaxis protein/anti-sigma regulatory factor (Ser/Thr protein kinase)
MFREVVTNLLSNAVKFTPTGGRVRVEVRAEGRDLLLSVEDTGIGIPEDEQERVFEEFYQVDRLHTRRHPGSGLGLTLVRRLVELHGGSVSVESTPGIGSCFTCRFPDCLRDAPAPGGLDAAPAAGPDAAPAGAMPSRLLLIVGGPRLDRKLMRNALRARGYRLLEADDAAEALDRLRGAERPDLALVDVDLEASHGLELIERLRLDPAAAGIPAAVVGSAADPDLLARARAAGAVGCLPKPLRLNRLPAEVERLIAAAAAAAVA